VSNIVIDTIRHAKPTVDPWPNAPTQVRHAEVDYLGEVGRSEYYRHPRYGEVRADVEWVIESTAAALPRALGGGPVLVRPRPEDPGQVEFKPLTKVPDGTYERLLHPEPVPTPVRKPSRVSPGLRSGITDNTLSGRCRDIDELDRRLAKQGIAVRPTNDPNYVAGYGPGGRIINDLAALINEAAPLYVARFAGDPLRCVVGDHGDDAPDAVWLAVGGAPICRECLT
jgi:hypothetical protein